MHAALAQLRPAAPAKARYLLISLAILVLDQWSKWWIERTLPEFASREVIPGVFQLTHVRNTGVAFGMFNGTQYANYAFTAVSLAALTFIYVMHRKGLFPGKLSRLAVALLVSGVFGNLTDRLFRTHDGGQLFAGTFLDGYVVDFLKFDFGFAPFHPWPSFNVADSCVVCVAILLALASFLEAPEPKKA